jgi:hypothetical protein
VCGNCPNADMLGKIRNDSQLVLPRKSPRLNAASGLTTVTLRRDKESQETNVNGGGSKVISYDLENQS